MKNTTTKAKSGRKIINTSPRTKWQQKRDNALKKVKKTKKDVWEYLVKEEGKRAAPSLQGVRAVLDRRYRDEVVERAFLAVCFPERTDVGVLMSEYFPGVEPAYKGPKH